MRQALCYRRRNGQQGTAGPKRREHVDRASQVISSWACVYSSRLLHALHRWAIVLCGRLLLGSV